LALKDAGQAGPADSCIALEHELAMDRGLAGQRGGGLDRLQRQEEASLVVGGAPGVDATVLDDRFKERVFPQVLRVHRLHVEVAVDEVRGLVGVNRPFHSPYTIGWPLVSRISTLGTPMARRWSAAHCAARRTSSLCRGRALTLGMRKKSRSC